MHETWVFWITILTVLAAFEKKVYFNYWLQKRRCEILGFSTKNLRCENIFAPKCRSIYYMPLNFTPNWNQFIGQFNPKSFDPTQFVPETVFLHICIFGPMACVYIYVDIKTRYFWSQMLEGELSFQVHESSGIYLQPFLEMRVLDSLNLNIQLQMPEEWVKQWNELWSF